ncbi:MAG: glycosyl hydrolase [Bacteroidota bacterium]
MNKTKKQPKLIFLITILLFLPVVCMHSQEKTIKDSESKEWDIEKMVSQINTEVDTDFVYDYKQTKFVPADGKTLLIMGQTAESITEYMGHFPNQQIPGGWSAYWGIPEFKGVTETHKNESGSSQNHQMLIDNFPNTVIQSAMWMVGKWNIAKFTGNGDYDHVIKKYSTWAKSVNRPIYLRIGYEFDGPHNELEPEEFIKAYRHIVDLIRKKRVDNIAFVWHSYASKPFKDKPLSAWYPGDDYVDWVAISVFGHAYNGTDFGPYCDDVLEFAKQHKKPVMIAEANPVKGIYKENNEVWDQWFVNFFSFIYHKNIKAISFINEDWLKLSIPGISHWKDARLYNNEKISKAWFKETDKERYLKQSAQLFEQLGYLKVKD